MFNGKKNGEKFTVTMIKTEIKVQFFLNGTKNEIYFVRKNFSGNLNTEIGIKPEICSKEPNMDRRSSSLSVIR